MSEQAELFRGDTPLGLSPRAEEERAKRKQERASAEEMAWVLASEPYRQRKPVLPSLPALEGEQLEALAAIDTFLKGPEQYFCLQGLAGTGKTTLLAVLARRLNDAALVAPTGKASAVLARKTGLQTSTLHKLLYMPKVDDNGFLVGFAKQWEQGGLEGRVALVDEASMVGLDLANDLLETGVRVVASGDPGQLPPVEEKPFFTTADFTLRQIRRQSAGSPIIRQAHRVREGLDYASDGEPFQVINRREAVARLDWADVVLCWRNDTRHRLNAYMRSRRGIPASAPPQPGEPVMCLRNHPSGMMNGELFTVQAYEQAETPGAIGCAITLDNGLTIERPWCEWKAPNPERLPHGRLAPFALGYAITVHKSQGSEWPQVLIMDEFTGADRACWLYTAITRASVSVCIVRKDTPA